MTALILTSSSIIKRERQQWGAFLLSVVFYFPFFCGLIWGIVLFVLLLLRARGLLSLGGLMIM
jgi:hypothetical protein